MDPGWERGSDPTATSPIPSKGQAQARAAWLFYKTINLTGGSQMKENGPDGVPAIMAIVITARNTITNRSRWHRWVAQVVFHFPILFLTNKSSGQALHERDRCLGRSRRHHSGRIYYYVICARCYCGCPRVEQLI
jgi:hypothetical protein